MLKFLKSVFIIVLVLSLFSCKQSNKRWQVKLATNATKDVVIQRYDQALFNINTDSLKEELKQLAPQFPFFLNANLDDTMNLISLYDYITDPKLIVLFEDSEKEFSDIRPLENDLSQMFAYYEHYFPNEAIPKVYSYISGIQFEEPVIFADSVLLFGLDNYLGRDYLTYKKLGLPRYMTRKMQAPYLVVDAANSIAAVKVYKDGVESRTLLDEIVKRGKTLYVIDALLPSVNDTLKINYSADQLNWCIENEENIWAFFIENELLYSSDFLTTREFVKAAPFTKGFGNDSPPRLGEWIGWQIVRSYMNKNKEITLDMLLKQNDAQQILKNSGYKP